MRRIFYLFVIIFLTSSFLFALSRFQDNTNETVTDMATGLLWQKCTAGLSGDNCLTGVADTFTWEDALVYCETLELGGSASWRLPNRNELRSIINIHKYDPSIDSTAFPNTQSSNYWTSTTGRDDVTKAWRVNFERGYQNPGYEKSCEYYVRCVSGP